MAKVSKFYLPKGVKVERPFHLWLDSDGHGKNGAPYRIREVLDDMEVAERMMNDLLDTIIQWSKQHDE